LPTIVEGLGFGYIDWGDVAMETLTGCNPFSKLKLAKKVSKMANGMGDCFLGRNSFSADTLVHSEEGKKPISEIKVGDKVLSYDERTEKTLY